jgi:hypothetical protein
MTARLGSLALLLAFVLFAACGEEDLKFGDVNETPTPSSSNTPNATTTPTASPTATPTVLP